MTTDDRDALLARIQELEAERDRLSAALRVLDAAVTLGRLGGKKGGLARAKSLTKKQRSAIARKAAQTRWAKRRSWQREDQTP